MGKRINEIKKPRASSTPTMVSVPTIAQATIKEIYIMCMPRLLDNEEKVEDIIQEIDTSYNKPSFPLEEVKKIFVEQYADKLGSQVLREIDIDTTESVRILYDQRTISLKKDGISLIRHFPALTSPWKSYTFDLLLREFSKARNAELHYIKEGKFRGPLWTSTLKPNEPLPPISERLTKEEKRSSWHLGNR